MDLLNSDGEAEDISIPIQKKNQMSGEKDGSMKKNEAEEIAKNAKRRIDELISEPPRDWAVRVKADEMTDMICRLLNEPKRMTVLRAVKRMGNIVSNELLRHTLSIEAMGGIKVNDGTRRREPGTLTFLSSSTSLLYSSFIISTHTHTHTCNRWCVLVAGQKRGECR